MISAEQMCHLQQELINERIIEGGQQDAVETTAAILKYLGYALPFDRLTMTVSDTEMTVTNESCDEYDPRGKFDDFAIRIDAVRDVSLQDSITAACHECVDDVVKVPIMVESMFVQRQLDVCNCMEQILLPRSRSMFHDGRHTIQLPPQDTELICPCKLHYTI